MGVFKTFSFEAAHRLPRLPPDLKCFRMHGHSYRVELHVDGPIDDELGWVVVVRETCTSGGVYRGPASP